ncbi:MAG: 4-alpha-glucanotransferase, partial [Saprospiraceae bacterium]|nr:4-alpha-glucanotransferase [Saprospiraceae bacterium]
LCILGNIPQLGSWDTKNPKLLDNADFPIWNAGITMPGRSVIEYKYGLFDSHKGEVIELEAGSNRTVSTFSLQDVDLAVITDANFRRSGSMWKGAGIALPVFSIRTSSSFGVGSFSDLHALIDWVQAIGMMMVQILPVNDTMATKSWLDSSPYSAISVFALHPLYLDLTLMPGFDSIDQELYHQKQVALNALSALDYEMVLHSKMSFARQIFTAQKQQLKKDGDFVKFREEHIGWLNAYVSFCVLRDRFNSPNFNNWNNFDRYSQAIYDELSNDPDYSAEIRFYEFLQFHLDNQFRRVRSYAREMGVVLKGDIAIGVLPYSADAWANPDLFYLDRQAGAPPDPFSSSGQNWGLPPYNWDAMARDGYQWWQDRLRHFARYFDAYRIDHILGFFRLWQIPSNQVQGLLGFFSPAIPVTRSEFITREITFDAERFCEPFITEASFESLPAEDAAILKQKFFKKPRGNFFQFKSQYNSQKKITAFFKKDNHAISRKFEIFLLQLHTEVLFIKELANGEVVFHPRINLQHTQSFKALDQATQRKLVDLHNDYFYHRQEEHWRELGLLKLPVIKAASDMLMCGEDLGMIPKCVPEVMQQLDILTLEIERMSKRPETEFVQPQDVPYFSVGSTSSHDMLPLRAWWNSLGDDTRNLYYRDQLWQEGLPPETYSSDLARMIIEKHLDWPCMWMVFPIQDIFALHEQLRVSDPLDERINVPGDTNHYWQYRIPVNIEKLNDFEEFNTLLDFLVKKYRSFEGTSTYS